MLKTKDLLQKLGEEKAPMVKMYLAAEYIAENFDGTEADAQKLNEILSEAKREITKKIIKDREDQGLSSKDRDLYPIEVRNLYDDKTANDILSMFITSPVSTLAPMVESQIVTDENELNNLSTEEKAKQEKYKAALNLLKGKENSLYAYDSARGDILNERSFLRDNLQELEGDDPVAEAMEEGKKGFFERIFRTTSKEYKNFEKVFKARGQGAATREELDNAAKAYLMHKLPRYDGQNVLLPVDFAGLKGKERTRAILCYKTLLANKQAREYESKMKDLKEVAEKNIDEGGLYYKQQEIKNQYSNLDVNADKQAQFQSDLKDAVSENSLQKNGGAQEIENPVVENENLIK